MTGGANGENMWLPRGFHLLKFLLWFFDEEEKKFKNVLEFRSDIRVIRATYASKPELVIVARKIIFLF